jgi:hypothetical protein
MAITSSSSAHATAEGDAPFCRHGIGYGAAP